MTFAAGGNLTIYINGVAQADVQALPAEADLANLGNWLVGAERSTDRQFIGALDGVYLYDSEISALQVATLAGVPEPPTGALFGLAGLAVLLRRRGAQTI